MKLNNVLMLVLGVVLVVVALGVLGCQQAQPSSVNVVVNVPANELPINIGCGQSPCLIVMNPDEYYYAVITGSGNRITFKLQQPEVVSGSSMPSLNIAEEDDGGQAN